MEELTWRCLYRLNNRIGRLSHRQQSPPADVAGLTSHVATIHSYLEGILCSFPWGKSFRQVDCPK